MANQANSFDLNHMGARLDTRHEGLGYSRAPHYLYPAIVLVLGAQDGRSREQPRVHQLQQLAHVIRQHLVQQEAVDDHERRLLQLGDHLLVAPVERGARHHELSILQREVL